MTTTRSEPADPWGPYGLVMASVWLVFLGYPLVASFQAPTLWQQITGVVLTLTFAAVYFLGCRHSMSGDLGTRERTSTPYYLAQVVLAILMVAIIGPSAIGVGIFLIGYALFSYRISLALLLATCAILGMALAMWATGGFEEVGFLLFIALGVMAMNTATRISITRGERYERTMRELSLAQERERVARDVHDVLGHSLTVIATKTELAERLLDVDLDRARDELAQVHTLTREAIAEVRTTVGGLRAKNLGEELHSAQVALDSAGVRAHLPNNAETVDPRNRVLFAWIVREAITNIVRHAGASRVQVDLSEHELTVADDGHGMGGATPGNGLRGLAERVGEAGGVLTIEDEPDGGTRLHVAMVTS